MKNWCVQAGLSVLLVVSMATAACSDDSDTTGTTAAGGSGGSSSGGTGGNANGGQSAGGNAQGGAATDPACGAPAVAPSAGECALDGGVLTFECNPITNEGCNPNEACDLAGMTGFSCYPGNTADLCEPCDQQAMSGPFCTEGTTCFSPDGPDGFGSLGTCARYCCDDGDCGGGTCVKTFSGAAWFMQAPNIGVCLE